MYSLLIMEEHEHGGQHDIALLLEEREHGETIVAGICALPGRVCVSHNSFPFLWIVFELCYNMNRPMWEEDAPRQCCACEEQDGIFASYLNHTSSGDRIPGKKCACTIL